MLLERILYFFLSQTFAFLQRCRLPLLLAYIPEHFVSVVPLLPDTQRIPLVDKDGMPLAVRFEPAAFQRSHLHEYLDIVHGDYPVR